MIATCILCLIDINNKNDNYIDIWLMIVMIMMIIMRNTTTITTVTTDDNDSDNNDDNDSTGLSAALLLNPKYTRTRQ